jgi:hypothetical protein
VRVTMCPVRTISRKPKRDPQRLYAEHSFAQRVMRQSDPHGDMRRVTEMITPPLSSTSGGNRNA